MPLLQMVFFSVLQAADSFELVYQTHYTMRVHTSMDDALAKHERWSEYAFPIVGIWQRVSSSPLWITNVQRKTHSLKWQQMARQQP